jgi:hypothetical protein
MAMFTGFKPQGLQKIASKMGYAGRMEEFDQYLQQNPDKQREMIVYQGKAQEMARGGMVKKMATGGYTGGVPGAAVIPNFVNPTTGQQYLNTEAAPDPSALVPYTGQAQPIAQQPVPVQSYADNSTITDVAAQRMSAPALPSGGAVIGQGIGATQEQFVPTTSGQVSGAVAVPTTLATTTQAEVPTPLQMLLLWML